ncbi:tRNA uridine-5-carboxymethylaminomethyl(34) synthesis GTPase MnmE [Sagittula sp. SSi028]|uniref:tRNA uridine-5-carboxymethylaminomethyl(34) synthesis GTPase MnmE n=1 Tax=Sagittula sp. SSi028 TaxID=3400636 RepID=UPI003AF97605
MDTIFALASAPGKAGVAVVRVSGPDAWRAAEYLAGHKPLPRMTSLRILKSPEGDFLDQAMLIAFEHGASFTGECVLELHLHGSIAVVKAVMRELARLPNHRLADPGEFTRRALENECLDLTQVEGLADLIDAETESQRKLAGSVLSGRLTDRVQSWRQSLITAASLIEATIDFVDEEVPVDVTDDVLGLLLDVQKELSQELSGSQAAEQIRTGFEVAIVGPPNAGKSTLLNYLAGRDAAITSDVAGTTRDVIEVRLEVKGFAVTFLDTAGLRDTDDPVERIGVQRARERAGDADIRIHLANDERDLLMPVLPSDLVLKPKQDIAVPDGVSGKTGYGVDRLLEHISEVLSDRVSGAGLASHERHRSSISRSLNSLQTALDQLNSGSEQLDLVAEDIRVSARHLEALVGKINVEHLLDEIFSSFCIGK